MKRHMDRRIKDSSFSVWGFDRGGATTQYKCVDDTLFTELNRNCNGKVTLADGTQVKAEGVGTVRLNTIIQKIIAMKSIYLEDMLLVLLLGANLNLG